MTKYALSLGLITILSGCTYSVEYAEDKFDKRITDSAEKLCIGHGGVYGYIVLHGRHIVECFDTSKYDTRTGEVY